MRRAAIAAAAPVGLYAGGCLAMLLVDKIIPIGWQLLRRRFHKESEHG